MSSCSLPISQIHLMPRADLHTPVLASDDVLEAYPYLAPPAMVYYDSGLTEIEAIARLRREGMSGPREGGRGWARYEDSLKKENMAVWAGVLARRAEPLDRRNP
jgi:hypothetical protein